MDRRLDAVAGQMENDISMAGSNGIYGGSDRDPAGRFILFVKRQENSRKHGIMRQWAAVYKVSARWYNVNKIKRD